MPLFEALATAGSRRVLAAAYANTGLTVGELSDAVGVSRQGAASLLDTFESLDLISRARLSRPTGLCSARKRNPRALLVSSGW